MGDLELTPESSTSSIILNLSYIFLTLLLVWEPTYNAVK